MFDLRAQVTQDDLARIDVDAARAQFEHRALPRQNSMTPWEGELPALGTWQCDPICGDFDILTMVPLDEVTPSEGELDIARRYPEFALYVQWAKEGRQAPPVSIVRSANSGTLLSSNRRRVLAAKDAGLTHILAWFSETNPDGRPAWQLPKVQYKYVPDGGTFWTHTHRYTKGLDTDFIPGIQFVFVPFGTRQE